MKAQTERETQPVAQAFLGDVVVAFYEDGSATMTACLTLPCDRGGHHDIEGEGLSFDPAEAWGLLQGVRRHLDGETYRLVSETIRQAIEG